MVLTSPNKEDTFNRLCLSTVAFESCRYNKLEKHKLNQIAEIKIRISLDKLVYSFLEVKLQRANVISVLYSQTVLITVYGGVKIHEVTRT